jgi:hypothetical protein
MVSVMASPISIGYLNGGRLFVFFTYNYWLFEWCPSFCFLHLLLLAIWMVAVMASPIIIGYLNGGRHGFTYNYRLFEWWSYRSWINNLCNQCLSPLMFWVQISLMARCTQYNKKSLKIPKGHKVFQWLVTGWQFSPGTPVSSTKKTDRHDKPEILLKISNMNPTKYQGWNRVLWKG